MARRLASLELQGFKTFATITRLEFPGQITAIVGPNGSGKSNIADSLRWALGEQSYSLLRGKRTEDMIFSGSQHRPRAGMAAVTITFNNEDGWLPIDYSEVSVSRRAYRDGQNEYLLNGQKVRLKDVSELLAQTGLAEMSYTIIGQGLVDVALALKPDERRQLFEEAAGIGLYRSRKEEALRRLETTRKNLDRVLDILTEIKPRLRSLEKQSARVLEFQQLSQDLQVLLREWYGYHWHQKQQDLRNARNAYHDQEMRLSELRLKHNETEEKVNEARQVLQENRKALESAHNESAALHRKLEQATRELAIIEERRRSFNQQKANLEIDIATTQQSIEALEAQKSSFLEEIEQRQEEYELAQDEANQADIKLAEITLKKESAEAALDSTRTDRVKAETDRVQVLAHLDELRNRVRALDVEREKAAAALEALTAEKTESEARAIRLDAAFEELQGTVNEIEGFQAKAKQQNGRLMQEKAALSETTSSLETALAKLMAQIEVLEQAEAALSGYSEGSKTVLEDVKAGKLPREIEPLAKHLVIEERYEKALSAALGELADVLVVPVSDQDVVIQYLEAKNADRVALVALPTAKPKGVGKAVLSQFGVIGVASDLVQVAPAYQSLAENLLSDILLVEDKKAALRVQPFLEGSQRAVTLSGLVVQANGVFISGLNAAGKRIGRTRRKNEMQTEASSFREKIQAERTRTIALEKELEENENDLHSLSEQLRGKQKALETARIDRQSGRDSLSRISEQLSWHQERLAEIETGQTAAKCSISSDEERLAGLEERIQDLHSDELLRQQEVAAFSVFELQQALNHWQTRQLVTQSALKSAQQRFTDHQHRIDEAIARLKTHQARLLELDNGLNEIHAQEKVLKEAVETVNQSISQVEETRIRPLTQAAEESEKTLLSLQKLADHSHQQVIIGERQYTQLQLELGRRGDQFQNLQQRIEDDFGLVSFDYDQKVDGPKPLPFADGLIENLPEVPSIPDSLEDDIKRLKNQIRRIGSINPDAQQEFLEVRERFDFMTAQVDDLEKASKDLHEVIEELDQLMERDFVKTFKAVNQEFSVFFTRLFNGGEARLLFSDEENPVEGGVDIEARLPGRRSQGLALLSGGERSLTAVALIFALLKVSPTPFCILDEVDAMLDESNVGRFIDLLEDLSQKTQFVVITHNRNTVQAADVIYGVTMGRDSTSQMISLKLEEVDEAYLE